MSSYIMIAIWLLFLFMAVIFVLVNKILMLYEDIKTLELQISYLKKKIYRLLQEFRKNND